MSTLGDALRALRTVLMLQDDVKTLKDAALAQGERLSSLAAAHANLRERVSRLEGMIEGAALATGRQWRIEE